MKKAIYFLALVLICSIASAQSYFTVTDNGKSLIVKNNQYKTYILKADCKVTKTPSIVELVQGANNIIASWNNSQSLAYGFPSLDSLSRYLGNLLAGDTSTYNIMITDTAGGHYEIANNALNVNLTISPSAEVNFNLGDSVSLNFPDSVFLKLRTDSLIIKEVTDSIEFGPGTLKSLHYCVTGATVQIILDGGAPITRPENWCEWFEGAILANRIKFKCTGGGTVSIGGTK